MRIVDAHTHAFPDGLAPHAVAALEKRGRITACLDGTVRALLASMDRAGIEASLVCSVATDPRQFRAILKWSREIASARIVPFPSVHPRAPEACEEVREVARAGLRGVKMHPEYQDFHVDDPALADLYGALQDEGLVLLLHAGYDLGYPDSDRSSPRRIRDLVRSFPRLRVIASHLGGYRRWGEVAELLVGTTAYLDTSYTLGHVPTALFLEIVRAHPAARTLFGTDSPWVDQTAALAQLRALGLEPEREEKILSGNARALLRLP